MTQFLVDMSLGDWSTTVAQVEHAGEVVLASGADPDDAYVLSGLSVEWSLDGDLFPDQPTPTQLKCDLYVPDIADGPDPRQGQLVAFTMRHEGYMRNRLPNAALRAPIISGWSGSRTNLLHVRDAQGIGYVRGTVNDASVTTSGSQRVNTPAVPCKPGEKCWGAAEVQVSAGSGLTQAVARLIPVDAAGADLSGGGATSAAVAVNSSGWALVEAPSFQPPAGTVAFKLRVFLPSSQSGAVTVGDEIRVRHPFLAVDDDATAIAYNRDNLQPVATFDGRISDVEAGVYRDGLTYSIQAVDHLVSLNEVTIGDEPWPEEFLEPFLPVGDPAHEDGRYARLAALVNAQTPALNVRANDTAPLDGDYYAVNTECPIPAAAGLAGTYGALTTQRKKDVDAQQAGDVLAHMMRDVVMVVHPTRAWQTTYTGNYNTGQHPALDYWLTPIMGQAVDDNGVLSLFPVWVSDRVLDNAFATQVQIGVDGKMRLADLAVESIPAGHAVHVPASRVDRGDVTWRMDKAVSPNSYREDSSGEYNGAYFSGVGSTVDSTAGQFLYFIDNMPPPAGPLWSFEIPGYIVGHWPLVLRNGAVQVKVENESTQDYVGNYRHVPILGRYYDAQPTYMVDSLTIYPGDLDGPLWPRLFAHRNPYGYFSGHLGRWLFVHGIDDRWNPHPHGLYMGQLTGATLTVAEGGRVTMTAQVRHREPGPAGPDGAVHAEDVPVGVLVNEVDESVRPIDLSAASRTVVSL